MKRTTYLIPYFLLAVFFSSCGKDYLTDIENELKGGIAELPESQAATPPNTYPQPTTNTQSIQPSAPTAQNNITEKNTTADMALPMMNVPTFGYYTLPENSPPLFSKSCIIMESPMDCSMEMLGEWLNEHLKETESGLRKGEYSVQYIFFELDEKGKIFNIEHAGSDGNVLCWACLQTALKTIEKMPDWVPAVKDGIPYNTSVKLPIRFEQLL